MTKIVSKRGKSEPMTYTETNEVILEHIDKVNEEPVAEQEVFEYYKEDWVISGLERSMLTWHFDPPAEPAFGDACLSLDDETVEIYTGTRWVRMTLPAL